MSKLSDCVEILDSKRIPLSSKQRERLKKIYPYYGAQGIIDYVDDYIFDGEYILVAEDGNNLKSLSENIATLATGKFWVNNHAHILGEKEGYDLKFIYYLLNNLDLRGYVTGSAQPKLNQSNLANIKLNIPIYEIQKKISRFLTYIDKKIVNNNKINFELESMAKTLYDYWFLQFEFPNEEGKPYKSSGGKMVWNEEIKMHIPKNWSVHKIITIADLYQPKTISGNEILKDGKYFVYGANGILGKYNEFNHRDNEIAICCRGASCGEFVMTLPYSWITGNAMVVKAKNDFYKEYIYFGLSKDRIEPFISGSAQPQITRTNLENMKVLVPEKRLIEEFNKYIIKIREKIQNSTYQNIELTSFRDFLLPLLMNGQVTFKDK